MTREELADLTVFVAVAQEGSFTRAATRLDMSQSAVSQITRRLEARLGVRLLSRTTRLRPGRVPDLPGYHLYYANRRNASPAFKLLVDAVRWRG